MQRPKEMYLLSMSGCDDNSVEMIEVMMTRIVRDERESGN
jgi:hypothetical protein